MIPPFTLGRRPPPPGPQAATEAATALGWACRNGFHEPGRLGICIDCGHAERTTNDQQRTA
jgi:hypothetical protein